MGIAALILGIIGLAGLIPFIGWLFIPLNILAVILGLIAVKNPAQKGMGIAGVILGAIPILAKIVSWVFIFFLSII